MTWVWVGWLVVLVLSFSVFEGYALKRGRLTLSMFTWRISQQWPPFPFILGLVAGGLAVHFWWHWCPGGGVGAG